MMRIFWAFNANITLAGTAAANYQPHHIVSLQFSEVVNEHACYLAKSHFLSEMDHCGIISQGGGHRRQGREVKGATKGSKRYLSCEKVHLHCITGCNNAVYCVCA